jgi:hypothetical protein
MLLQGEISHSNRIWRVHYKAEFLTPTKSARFCIRAQADLHKARSATNSPTGNFEISLDFSLLLYFLYIISLVACVRPSEGVPTR